VSVAFRQLRVYVRGIIILTVAVAIALVLFKNRDHTVSVWFFGLTDDAEQINVVSLMLCTAAGTLVSWWALSLAWALWRDMREVKRLRTIDGARKVLDQRAAELKERERRVDGKLQEAIAKEQEDGDEQIDGADHPH